MAAERDGAAARVGRISVVFPVDRAGAGAAAAGVVDRVGIVRAGVAPRGLAVRSIGELGRDAVALGAGGRDPRLAAPRSGMATRACGNECSENLATGDGDLSISLSVCIREVGSDTRIHQRVNRAATRDRNEMSRRDPLS